MWVKHGSFPAVILLRRKCCMINMELIQFADSSFIHFFHSVSDFSSVVTRHLFTDWKKKAAFTESKISLWCCSQTEDKRGHVWHPIHGDLISTSHLHWRLCTKVVLTTLHLLLLLEKLDRLHTSYYKQNCVNSSETSLTLAAWQLMPSLFPWDIQHPFKCKHSRASKSLLLLLNVGTLFLQLYFIKTC